MIFLAQIYLSGAQNGIPRDYVQAKRWFKKHAELGGNDSELSKLYVDALSSPSPQKAVRRVAVTYTRKGDFSHAIKFSCICDFPHDCSLVYHGM